MSLKTIIEKIKELSSVINDTDIESVSIDQNGTHIGIRKINDKESVKEGKAKGGSKKVSEKQKEEFVEVTSHSVGLFRDFIPPVRKSFTRVGQKIKKGEKIGAIESMKILKEITSPVNGKISQKFVKHGDPVQYGQKLFEVKIV